MANTQTIDHGTDGEAMKARPYEMLGNDRDPVTVKRYSDILILDTMAHKGLLGDDKEATRRITAGEWYLTMHNRAFPPKATTAAYGQVRGGVGEGETYENRHDPDGPPMDSCIWHRALLRDLDREVGKNIMAAIHRTVVEGKTCVPSAFCADLDALAQHRGIA